MKTRYSCSHPQCLRSPATGHIIWRITPVGEPFEGLCERHYHQRETREESMFDRKKAKRLLAEKKRAGKPAEYARAEVARELGCRSTDLFAIDFSALTGADCSTSTVDTSGSGLSFNDGGASSSYDSGSTSGSDAGVC